MIIEVATTSHNDNEHYNDAVMTMAAMTNDDDNDSRSTAMTDDDDNDRSSSATTNKQHSLSLQS